MKILVTYLSMTNNTKKIAEAIYSSILEDKEIYPIDNVKSLEGYDLTFIGGPIHASGLTKKVCDFITTNAKGRKIALFCTHAMAPGIPELDNELEKCKEAAKDSELIGFFDCQGELAENVANALLKAPDPRMQEFGKRREETKGHPNAAEIESAKAFSSKILSKIS